MSAQFYNRMNGLATRLLTNYGHSIELVDAQRNVLDTYQGLKSGIGSENIPASVLEASTAVVFVTTGTVTPQMGNYLRISDVIYRITHIDDIKPTDIGILFKIFISDGA